MRVCSSVPQGVIVLPLSAFKSPLEENLQKNPFAWHFKNLETDIDNYLGFSCLQNVENSNLSKTKSETSLWHLLMYQQPFKVFRLVDFSLPNVETFCVAIWSPYLDRMQGALILFWRLRGWHVPFGQSHLSVPLRSIQFPSAAAPAWCLPWEGCLTACFIMEWFGKL